MKRHYLFLEMHLFWQDTRVFKDNITCPQFSRELFLRLIEKVKVQSMAEWYLF